MANWITKNPDPDSVVMDALCLCESAWWGTGETAYKGWDHGIYAWRQLCLDVAPWLHSAWQRAEKLQGGEDTVTFDCEFCEVIGTKLLEANTDQFHPYMLQRWVEEEYTVLTPREHLARLLEDENSDEGDIREAIGAVLEGMK